MALTETRNNDLIHYWPFGAGGLVWPLLVGVVNRWLPFPLAAGGSMFVCFSAAAWICRARLTRAPEGVGRALSAALLPGCAAGLVAGFLAFLFPWR